MLSVQHARALVAIVAFLCVYPVQYVQANTCDPDFDRDCICDDYVFEINCRFTFRRHRSTAGIIAGSIIAVLALIALIITLFVFKRRRDRFRVAQSQAIHAAASAGPVLSQPPPTYQQTTYQPPATYYTGTGASYPPPPQATPYTSQPGGAAAQYYGPTYSDASPGYPKKT
ncbi:hypothetical protein K435DRAFT_963623 [Dendrothele bispora CBS 962.96]|uniref:Uncharacterized protein n=1 Tax=Dendrothele bispora (strain CBS 962.96) TaxID=1314807 RepID=A0A4V4HH43_DENBC|nr:hypothetical protein K435DRAFT_963623 [Dendrothele bispora CBS 962.96]